MSDAAVDLRSDTVTRPSPGMRRAMADAVVDDDVLGKDPTADRLERRVAELLGKDAALFFPSGTQANQAAVILHTHPGTEAVCEAESHVFHYEYADAAWLAGVQLHPVTSARGSLTARDVAAAIRPGDRHHPLTTLLCVENTHNLHGGAVVPLPAMQAIRALSRETSLPVHLDGARLWNAATAAGVALSDFASCADTVTVCISKGLGCPIGSLLAGSSTLIADAWSVRKRLGGGMRQVGILAAAGLWALDHNLDRLGEDHERARRLARETDSIDGLRADVPDTNIVMIHLENDGLNEETVAAELEELGVQLLPAGPGTLRAVTHLDVDDEGIERCLEALSRVAAAS
ncbi:MAG: aminotransferase class I/II-fold pyridoxal phosphate-dependent enzyme [Gemmatimonadetes bacterium]|nr:aminotransferase class I/II-fold pyridoxal phosphate-dependent enzyme [Gemmatimonadota bacterium]MBT8479893.1 aminotransferase class I/II-fold pyridoxal phosphate-dependent enzyme [Gemmatimonadota bacterium]NNK48523.1 aminotransferase class I/II-fold pyridoxal phosphate-dependent enzyme [Gemmatimonadota bacterium]